MPDRSPPPTLIDARPIVVGIEEDSSKSRSMESDHDLAFRLQMEEAIAASLSLLSTSPVASASSSTASTSRLNSPAVLDGNPVRVYHRPAVVRDEFEMDRRDRELSQAEVRIMPFDLSHRFRDQKPASHDVRRLPAVKCVECGDLIQIASGEGSSSGARPLLKNGTYRAHTQSILPNCPVTKSEERRRTSAALLVPTLPAESEQQRRWTGGVLAAAVVVWCAGGGLVVCLHLRVDSGLPRVSPERSPATVDRGGRQIPAVRSVWVGRRPPVYAFIDFEDPRDAKDAIGDIDGWAKEDS